MSDLIDRQAAIDVVKGIDTHFVKFIEDIPAAQQSFENDTEIKRYSKDVIDRQAAIDLIESIETERLKGNIELIYAPAIKGLRALPPAQPEPSQVAKDIARIVGNENDMRVIAQPEIIRCKDCKHWIPYDWMFSEVWQSKNIADYPEDEIGCNYCDMTMKANDFCSRGERREVTT